MAGAQWSREGSSRNVFWLLRYLLLFFRLRKEAKNRKIGALIIQSPLFVLVSFLLVNSFAKRRVWLMPNVIGINYPFGINRLIYQFCTKVANLIVLPNSHFTGTSIGGPKFFEKVIYPGVDCCHYQPESLKTDIRAKLKIPSNSVVFCIASSITPIKGHREFIRALALADTGVNRPHLMVCGGPTNTQYFQELEDLAYNTGLEGRVHFVGAVNDLRPYFLSCDVLVNPSKCAEGFGLSVVEAMSCGLPVIAHDLGGPGETVVDGKTGWLFAPCDVATMSMTIERCMEDLPKWKSFGRLASERAAQLFSSEKFIDEIARILSE